MCVWKFNLRHTCSMGGCLAHLPLEHLECSQSQR
uniref:Uncharacterized protein n=1 Tax=Anguilla anguilla TaxID=7936 RepID=A0A0E9P942_ANGAN